MRLFFLILGPVLFIIILFLPLPNLTFPAHIVLGTALWMAIWWISEAIPIPATSLLPLLVFPLFGLMTAQGAASPYANKSIFLFLGGFFIARAMECHGLHKRIALNITLFMGRKGDRNLILGFMVATAFLSLWISNTATTMMMFPIALALTRFYQKEKFSCALLLGIAYAASIGGIGTLVGTPPNIVFAGFAKEFLRREVTFARWFIFAMPVVILFLPLAWFIIIKFFKVRGKGKTSIDTLKNELQQLGKPSREEVITLGVFILTAILWIFRKSINIGFFTIPGWSNLLGIDKFVDDSTIAILGALILFILPPLREGKCILNWKEAVQIPWGVILLFGGGFSLARAFKVSGLSEWVGNNLLFFKQLPLPLLVISVALLVTFLTELTSNTATTTLLLPIMASLANSLEVNPLYLILPTVISASCAFMLPVATPPNAIIFGSEKIKIKEMVKVGVILNLIGVIIVSMVTLTIGKYIW
jgi:sodium-dependent dicarboxylate transporter 2/3/5